MMQAADPVVVIDMTGSKKKAAAIELTKKEKERLDARLEGTLAKRPRGPSMRINWDLPQNFKLRRRLADSWTNKNDLYVAGDSFGAFCTKTAIDRNVLKRYLQGKYLKSNQLSSRRGRPTLLAESVMRHLCEGAL